MSPSSRSLLKLRRTALLDLLKEALRQALTALRFTAYMLATSISASPRKIFRRFLNPMVSLSRSFFSEMS